MMNLKSITLMILSLVALLALAPGCGDEPDDDRELDTGTNPEGNGTDSESDTLADTTPIQDLNTLVGNVYVLDMPDTTWTQPPVVASEVGKTTPTFAFTIQSVDAVANTFTALLGTVKDGVQDPCGKTYVMQGTFTQGESTTFTLGPMDIQAIVVVDSDENNHHVKVIATLHGFQLTGQFINQGAAYKFGSLTAELDARDVYSLFYAVTATSGDDLCQKLPPLGASCATCSFEPASTLCLVAKADGFRISLNSLVTLAPVADFGPTCLNF